MTNNETEGVRDHRRLRELSMKAAAYYQNGGPEVFKYEEVPRPDCTSDGVLIEIAYISVEGGDLISSEIIPLESVPYIVGCQYFGRVVEMGTNVYDLKVGQSVGTILSWGPHAEFVMGPARNTWLIPDGMAMDVAAAVPVSFSTANECLFSFGGLKEGLAVLIHAGAGALGLAAIQLAKRIGATVFATVSDEIRLARLREFGADMTINYVTDDFVEIVKVHTQGDSIDLVIDSIAGKNLPRCISALKYRGRVIMVGVSDRDPERLDPVSLRPGCNSVQGVFFPSSLPHEHERGYVMVAV